MADSPSTDSGSTGGVEMSSDSAYRTLSNRMISVCAVVLVLLAGGVGWLLLAFYGRGDDADRARLESVRTVGTIVLGAGGAMALLLAARRQQTAERELATKRRDLLLREQANDDVRHDAAERRITEGYIRAAEQLGSDAAPVRLAGLYALDRLGQDNPSQRQTIAGVVSAYLRMPYDLPAEPPGPEVAERERAEYRGRLQEREVRLTAQRILTGHLDQKYGDGCRCWEDIEIDLSGAFLVDFKLKDCQISDSRFVGARFVGNTFFLGVDFTGDTRFDGAEFDGETWFSEATFSGSTRFDHSVFNDDARFDEAAFTGATSFRDSLFVTDARFGRATFAGTVVMSGSTFSHNADFSGASFVNDVWLPGVTFAGRADFDRAVFRGEAWFSQVTFSSYTNFDGAAFQGDIRFSGSTLDGVPYRPEQLQPYSVTYYDGASVD